MDLNLKGKRVLVTGSASGIGRATAAAFLREGAEVVMNGLTEAEVAAALAQLSPLGPVRGLAADIATADGAEALLAFAGAGGVDVLVNNVGIFSVKPFAEVTDAEWLHTFNVNVLTAVRMSRAILPDMLARGTGAIVNLASEAGVKPLPQMVHYSVTKTAMIGLTRGLAELTKGTAVTVNAVLPGPTWTEGVEAYFRGLAMAKAAPIDGIIGNYFREDEPTSLIQRFVRPEEVARMIAFVAASPAANGGAYRIEGGIIRSIL
ncbi:SDR family NAD(P)-dependent oxidoreductase [Labrys wisconsinensis]|uniref:NAD(P)-dependent dehydrogenase (Short-subunit alcohol dehydrogenase family) n=1 Tax=Labrys wisconsinensis TaxID=425677 RepID=A0ABU0J925_9HYPH|nr:SDR family oxidoreductase [Labrys wisconsinensis]MDQ0469933.1 NAD(P)-dependent dehydrogenase (short-subunit alcohol dehydrogenase family) [Labrys wisconsinensis]